MLADLHCHFPMHLVAPEREHPEHPGNALQRVVAALETAGFEIAAHWLNHPWLTADWRVDLAGLQVGGVGIVCSVLYWPFAELAPGEFFGASPGPRSFEDLQRQLCDVEHRLAEEDPSNSLHVIVKRSADLDDKRMKFVHCVEGGFHLGNDVESVRAHVGDLADRGVAYITLAHLFFRNVAANAPAIPKLSDEEYDAIFHQPKKGLPMLGRAAIETMVKRHVIVDVSHMRPDVMHKTFEILNKHDVDRRLPVIASHVGVQSEGPQPQSYNLRPDAMHAIKERDGVIGLILAQHQLGETASPDDSRDRLAHHIDAIHNELGTHAHTAIGSDLDGFIKPTLTGIERAGELALLQEWIREAYPMDADAILYRNVERVLRRVFELRGA